ncbi:MAG: methyltransferase, partial [Kofleriaceae bacterium]
DPEIARRYQRHLVAASAPAARELAATLVPLARPDATPVHAVDIGAGAGAYSRALLEADSRLHVTVVDQADVVELARAELADFAARTRFVAGDARRIDLALAHDDVNRAVRDGSDHARGFDLAIVANVLHLHAPAVCAELCMVAARAVRVGGVVAIVDLRRGTLEGEMFALNMALYTEGGGVYSVEQIHAWLCEAGLELIPSDVPIDASASSALARRLESAPEMIVVLARRI